MGCDFSGAQGAEPHKISIVDESAEDHRSGHKNGPLEQKPLLTEFIHHGGSRRTLTPINVKEEKEKLQQQHT